MNSITSKVLGRGKAARQSQNGEAMQCGEKEEEIMNTPTPETPEGKAIISIAENMQRTIDKLERERDVALNSLAIEHAGNRIEIARAEKAENERDQAIVERDEARAALKNAYNYICLNHTDRERSELVTGCPICRLNQLRKVADELARITKYYLDTRQAMIGQREYNSYNSLPHVIAMNAEKKCTCGEPHISDKVVHRYDGNPCYLK